MSNATKNRKCSCGRNLTPLANGTAPRHTNRDKKRCHGSGRLFPAIARERNYTQEVLREDRLGTRVTRRTGTKNTYKRNASGGYNGRTTKD